MVKNSKNRCRGRRKEPTTILEEWPAGFLVVDHLGTHYILQPRMAYARAFYWVEVDPETIGRFSGLRDVSPAQNEVYEGDIVEIEYNATSIIGEIVYEQGCFFILSAGLNEWESGGMLPLFNRVEEQSWFLGKVLGNRHIYGKEWQTIELCPHCGNEVEIPSYRASQCPQCKETIIPCSSCKGGCDWTEEGCWRFPQIRVKKAS